VFAYEIAIAGEVRSSTARPSMVEGAEMRQFRSLAYGRLPDIPQRDECPVAGLLATAESAP